MLTSRNHKRGSLPEGFTLKYPAAFDLLGRIRNLRTGVIGDVCLDLYWDVDTRFAEPSRETGLLNRPVVAERAAPGAAANLAVNMAALEARVVRLLGIVGADWRGRLLRDALRVRGVSCDGLLDVQDRSTDAYCKPMLWASFNEPGSHGSGHASSWNSTGSTPGVKDSVQEDARIDFINRQRVAAESAQMLIEVLNDAASSLDVLCVVDQLANGCLTEAVRRAILRLAANGLSVFVDSRQRIADWPGCILKPNEQELMAASPAIHGKPSSLQAAAAALQKAVGAPVCVTLGSQGCYLSLPGGQNSRIPALDVPSPIDICGAGDCFMASFALASAAGAPLPQAAELGTRAAAVAVRKIGTTGSASPAELLETWR